MKSVDVSIHHYIFPNINEDGWKFISLAAVLALVAALIWFPLGCVFFVLALWCFYSFRDVNRVTPVLSGAVIAPADGYVVAISREKGPSVFGLDRKNFTKICVYSGFFDAHISRIPVKSTVSAVFYDSGRFTGNRSKNDIRNERLLIALKHSGNTEFVIQQTATFCGGRLRKKIKKGDELLAGQRFGWTRFCAYTEIFLPDKTEPQVCVGQYLIGGETVIADVKSDAPRLEGEIRK